MADLAVTVGAVRLPNPILPASGTFGIGHARVMDLDRLGALVPKTVTPGPRRGHPPARAAETAGGLLNAIGIPSAGIDAFLRETLPPFRAHTPPLIVSVSADTADGFGALAARLDGEGLAALELNLSCPNLEEGGRAFALDPPAAAAAVAAARAATRLPLWAKLSPAAGAPVAVAKAAADAGADALILANTLVALALTADGTPALANRTGGLSGPPLKPVNLRMVDEIARSLPLPLIGCGGVASLPDVLDYLAAGASAVAVGTATFTRPTTMIRLIDALAAHCDARGIAARDLTRR